jgi:hypothetical protein
MLLTDLPSLRQSSNDQKYTDSDQVVTETKRHDVSISFQCSVARRPSGGKNLTHSFSMPGSWSYCDCSSISPSRGCLGHTSPKARRCQEGATSDSCQTRHDSLYCATGEREGVAVASASSCSTYSLPLRIEAQQCQCQWVTSS